MLLFVIVALYTAFAAKYAKDCRDFVVSCVCDACRHSVTRTSSQASLRSYVDTFVTFLHSLMVIRGCTDPSELPFPSPVRQPVRCDSRPQL